MPSAVSSESDDSSKMMLIFSALQIKLVRRLPNVLTSSNTFMPSSASLSNCSYRHDQRIGWEVTSFGTKLRLLSSKPLTSVDYHGRSTMAMALSMDQRSIAKFMMLSTDQTSVVRFKLISSSPFALIYNTRLKVPLMSKRLFINTRRKRAKMRNLPHNISLLMKMILKITPGAKRS